MFSSLATVQQVSKGIAERAAQQRAAALQTPAGAYADQQRRALLQPSSTKQQAQTVDLAGSTPGLTTTGDKFAAAAEAASVSQLPQAKQPNIDMRNQYTQNSGILNSQNMGAPQGNPQLLNYLKTLNNKLF